MSDVIVVIGAGSIGQAIARRVGAGKQIVLADLNVENANAAADVMRDAGFDVSTATVDVSSRESVHALVETGMGSDGAFITGSDFLMDGGVTASYFYGELAPE